ncbi:hypothetical protein K470DRAFT_267307 [Piedraia hortae CBS 480.64]|uniref:OBG-type G domain-containing protein n=1 Tax=Piedraia hortae CBS 480.64 TaxID=1314780 RepID=A0A6A7CAC2_9PEZI|nr:hypothetical protein K470DRAFT_267307 [Piedraia hortae CBS 480.64]
MVRSSDSDALALLGKKQVLERRFSLVSMFAFAVCELITWETVLALFGQAFENGGPAGAVFGFIIAWASTLSVYTVISELASMAPIASGQYYWVYMLAPQRYKQACSYVIGWLTSLAWIATVATECLFAGTIIQGVMVMDYSGYEGTRWQGTLLTWAVILCCIFINVVIPNWLPRFEVFILVLHIAGFLAIVITMWVMSPSIGSHASVWQTVLNEGGWPTQGLSFCVGFLGNVATFVGADASVHMAEEVSNSALNIPRAILAAMLINGAVGFIMMVTVLYCLGDVKSVLDSATGFPFLQVFLNSVGNVAGATVMAAVVLALTISCSTGITTSASRMTWSFARDNGLPGSHFLSRVSPRTAIPVNAVLTVTGIAALLTLIYIGSSTAFEDVISLTITGFYGSYFLPAALLLWRRLKGDVAPRNVLESEQPEQPKQPEHLPVDSKSVSTHEVGVANAPLIWGPWKLPGVLGTINNAYACTYMIFVIFWSVWPPSTPVKASTMNYSVVVTGGVMILSAIWYFVRAKKVYKGPLVDLEVAEVMRRGSVVSDIVLSRTQRRLPTQIRAGFKITRIRAFYTRKVKFTAETFSEKLTTILTDFPRLTDIHPFHRDLMNTLYDVNHYRTALGQLNTAKGLIETVSRDYVRLLKYAQSLFQCKSLKRAALGRMATICKRLKDVLVYLEQVRQHLGRLPSIDPNTRTLLICGYPNVGKSSFLKNITRADVDVQPYAFTTKSLYVGHFDYKLLRFQAIDTPGILDHPLDEMNSIEYQSMIAIAHLRSAVLYFMDLSEQCGYSVQAQMQLFKSIRPLFQNKLVFIVINKIDSMRPEDLDEETQTQLQDLLKSSEVEMLQLSCTTTEGLMAVRNAACDQLLAQRHAEKLNASKTASGEPTGRMSDVLKRLHVAQPAGGVVREAYIPEAALSRRKHSTADPNRPKGIREIEAENGGAGVFNVDLKEQYLLADPSWKHDKVPEVFNGMNVADYAGDPDILQRLAELEEEEAANEAEGVYDDTDQEYTPEEMEIRDKAEMIREKIQLIRNENRMRKTTSQIPRSKKSVSLQQLQTGLKDAGYDFEMIAKRANEAAARKRKAVNAMDVDGESQADAMDIDPTPAQRLRKNISTARVPREGPTGVTNPLTLEKARKRARLDQRGMNRNARQGEADRHTTASKPKWLLAGKRKMGSTRSR